MRQQEATSCVIGSSTVFLINRSESPGIVTDCTKFDVKKLLTMLGACTKPSILRKGFVQMTSNNSHRERHKLFFQSYSFGMVTWSLNAARSSVVQYFGILPFHIATLNCAEFKCTSLAGAHKNTLTTLILAMDCLLRTIVCPQASASVNGADESRLT